MKIKNSEIHGKGAFSDKSYKKGDLIGLAHTNGQASTDLGRYHNHSETPNAESKKIGEQRYLYTNRPLKKEEEITVDYRKQPELEQPNNFNDMKEQENLYTKILQFMQNGGMAQNFNIYSSLMPYNNVDPQQTYQPTPNYFAPQQGQGSVYGLDANGLPVSMPSTGVMNQQQTQQNQAAQTMMAQPQSLVAPTQLDPAQAGAISPTDAQVGINQQNRNYNFSQYGTGSDGMMPFNFSGNQYQTKSLQVPTTPFELTDPSGQNVQNFANTYGNDFQKMGLTEYGKSATNGLDTHDVPNPEQSQMYNPYSSYDTSSAAFTLGNAIGGGTSKGRGALAGGKILLSLGRDISSGIGNGKRQKFLEDEYKQKQIDALKGNFEDGGQFNFSSTLQAPEQFMQDGGQLTLPQSLTGEFVEGMPEGKEDQSVVELEKGEHVMQPDGTTSEVVGNKHSQGGEKLSADQIQEGSIVISDKLPIGKDNAEYFRDKYDIKLKAKDTYATVVDKVKNKIGITKNTKEQEEAFKQLEKEEKNTKDVNTKNLNREFLSNKINELEQEKQELEPARLEAMKEVYEKQEASKPKREQSSVDPQMMAQLAQQNNIAPEQAQQIVEQFMKGGQYKKMQEGGPLTKEDINNVNATTGIQFTDEMANSLFMQSPQEVRATQPAQDPLNYGWYKDEGYIDVQKNGDNYMMNPTQKNPYNYVDYIRMVDRIKEMNPNQKIAANYIPMENRGSYQDGTGNLRYSDPKAIAALEKLSKDLDYKEDFENMFNVKEVDGKKIYTVKEGYNMDDPNNYFFTKVKEIKADENQQILATSLQTIPQTNNIKAQGLPYGYKEINPQEGLIDFSKTLEPDSPIDGVANTGEKKPEAGNPLQNLPLLPDQSVLPPSAMQPPLKIENRLQRIDSLNISPEQQLAENQRQATSFQSMIGNLPPNQQALMMSQILSQTQNANNQVISATNTQNAQIDNQTQLYNAQASDKENLLAGQNALNYEDRTFRTQAVYEENLNQYLDYLRNVNTQNFNDVRNQNTVNQMFGNYNLDANGNIVMTPQQYQLYANNGQAIQAPAKKK